ncbi:MBOAT family O-acyltransferase [Roseobacter sp.]|uniref:MBOAT family O-acyltransferase n=1 Tax=Roseobacter sp. TaxID=1907202 RepID=UPI0038598287
MIQVIEWWLFLGLMPVVYWSLPASWRTWALAVASLGLLSIFAGPELIAMLTLAAAIFAGFRYRENLPTPLGIVMRAPWPAVAVLGYFVWSKYLPAMGRLFLGAGSFLDFAVPLGISYFAFKLLHYVIEMRRGNFPDHSAGDFVSWLFLAPIFTAGPIERFDHFLAEREIAHFRMDFVTDGIMRIAQGLFKKMILGGAILGYMMPRITDGNVLTMLGDLGNFSIMEVWALLVFTLIFVYLDFSAYSDIAIGSSRLFGLRIMENFNLPFLATNLQNFWQRWHMTLAHWCRSYIYMTMIGLTRNPYWAVIATFLVMGLWHSASPHWLAWGLWHGLGLAWLLVWGRFAMKRKIRFFKTTPGKLTGWALTMGYVSLGGAFTMLNGRAPITESIRLIVAAFGIA